MHTYSQEHGMRFSKVLASISLLCVSLSAQKAPANPPMAWNSHFEDVARQSGLTVAHVSSPEKHYIIESVSGGVGLFDCDNDGKLDVVVVNGSTAERFRPRGHPIITLYHRDPPRKLTGLRRPAGLPANGWCMG